jgi:hypothetical protein
VVGEERECRVEGIEERRTDWGKWVGMVAYGTERNWTMVLEGVVAGEEDLVA